MIPRTTRRGFRLRSEWTDPDSRLPHSRLTQAQTATYIIGNHLRWTVEQMAEVLGEHPDLLDAYDAWRNPRTYRRIATR